MKDGKKGQGALARWASKPYVPGATRLLFYLCVACIGCYMWGTWRMDNDSYYMLPAGESILAEGIPYENGVYYHKDAKIVVQQWLYCIGMHLADRAAGNLGLMLFMITQAMAVFWITERFIRKATRDPFWSHLAAGATIMLACPGYTFTLRPENVTIFMLFLQCLSLERWRETKKIRWLMPMFPIMLAEANLHISMWPAHLCIWLAYLAPCAFPWIQSKASKMLGKELRVCPGLMEQDGVRPSLPVLAVLLPSTLLVLANPYGLDGMTYLFDSMPVFSVISIKEQMSPFLVSALGIMDVCAAALLVILIAKKMMRATEGCLAAGFVFLSWLNYHNTIFLPIALACMCRAMLRWLESKGPALAKDIAPNGTKALLYACTAGCITLVAAGTLPQLDGYKEHPDMDAAIQYVKENQLPGGNILNNMNTGPMLQYHGITGIMGDTRPELLTEAISGQPGLAEELTWFCNGYMLPAVAEKYSGFQDYLDRNNIQFVMDITDGPNMAYLWGWMEGSGQWELHEFGRTDGQEGLSYGVWERTGPLPGGG